MYPATTRDPTSDPIIFSIDQQFSEIPGPDPLSRITVGAMEDVWGVGSVNYAMAQPFNGCRRRLSVDSANTTKVEYNVEHPGAANLGDVIVDRARSGKPIFDYQLDVLSKEQREEVLSLLEQYGTQVVETK